MSRMNTETRKYNNRVSHDEFVRAYLACKDNQEVADKLGMNRSSVIERASRLRKFGVKLPTRVMRRPHQEYIDELNQLIEDLTELGG